jgi:hypothetical protein
VSLLSSADVGAQPFVEPDIADLAQLPEMVD